MMAAPHDYLRDIDNTDLMRVVVALATEVYALRDRMAGMERALREAGTDLSALDAPTEPAAYDGARAAERDAFVARVFEALARPV